MISRPFPVVLLAIAITACSGPASWPKGTFTSEAWLKAPEGERYRFARDLVERRLLQGKTASEVKRLLGQPSGETADGRMAYVVKLGGSGFDQVYTIDIRFGSGSLKVVEKAFIRGD